MINNAHVISMLTKSGRYLWRYEFLLISADVIYRAKDFSRSVAMVHYHIDGQCNESMYYVVDHFFAALIENTNKPYLFAAVLN